MAAVVVPAPLQPFPIAVPGKPWTVEPVEVLVQHGVESIPQIYRRRKEHDAAIDVESTTTFPPPNPSTKRIPVIDLANWNEAFMKDVHAQLQSACEEWGFFRIINHGIPLSLMHDMMTVAKEFMALPVEEKAAYTGTPGVLSEGYGSRYIIKEDIIRDWRDFLYLRLQPLSFRNYDSWPTKPSSFRETLEEYSAQTKKLAQKLLAILSTTLGLNPSYLVDALVEPHQKMLINYYPACPQPELTDGFHKHSDFGALTLVLQEDGVEGLEVRHKGEWVRAEPIEGSFVVNVGDQTEVLSNGRYKSIEHRVVVNRDKSRISVPVFFDAAPEARVSPAKELLQEEAGNVAKYKQLKFDEYEMSFYDHGAKGKQIVESLIITNDRND